MNRINNRISLKGVIGEIKKIKNLSDVKECYKKHESTIKKIAVPVLLVIIILILWVGGNIRNNYSSENDYNVVVEDAANANGSDNDNGNGNSTAYSGNESNEINSNGEILSGGNSDTENDNYLIYVDLSGAVKNPGVYQVKSDTRLFQVIERAGGLRDDANTDGINQAEAVFDGQKIIVPSNNPDSPYYIENSAGNYVESSQGNVQQNTNNYLDDNEQKININTAGIEELTKIPGVGPAKAQRIIDYRESKGFYKSIDELTNIDGIGAKTLESMREYITT